MEFIETNSAPVAVGPYSQAIVAKGMVFCSGQISLKLDGVLVEGGIREQTGQVLENLSAVLGAAGSGLAKAVKCTVYLKDMTDFAAMNEVYAEYFRDHKPARVTIQAGKLPKDVMVEIDCIALV
jgi:2-iminobutanoate/2-iminopropanoate deaminase